MDPSTESCAADWKSRGCDTPFEVGGGGGGGGGLT